MDMKDGILQFLDRAIEKRVIALRKGEKDWAQSMLVCEKHLLRNLRAGIASGSIPNESGEITSEWDEYT